MNVDDRIRAALQAAAEDVRETDLSPTAAPSWSDRGSVLEPERPARTARWLAPWLAAAAAVLAVAGTVAYVGLRDTGKSSPPAAGPTAPIASATPPPPSTASTARPTSGSTVSMMDLYEPLWPFASLAQARQWDPNSGSLVRYAASANDTAAPWELVGSDDTDFSLERPAYRSLVHSPMTVGGHITGVDENITVVVRGRTGNPTVLAAIPAGGSDAPWSCTVAFSQSDVLIIVASTGGHVSAHERFAIQGVQTG